jgi:hypothetical protein
MPDHRCAWLYDRSDRGWIGGGVPSFAYERRLQGSSMAFEKGALIPLLAEFLGTFGVAFVVLNAATAKASRSFALWRSV